jgi:hypothetical protein
LEVLSGAGSLEKLFVRINANENEGTYLCLFAYEQVLFNADWLIL